MRERRHMIRNYLWPTSERNAPRCVVFLANLLLLDQAHDLVQTDHKCPQETLMFSERCHCVFTRHCKFISAKKRSRFLWVKVWSCKKLWWYLFVFPLPKVGNLFGSHRSTIINLYNGAFDSSSALFFIIKVAKIHKPSLYISWINALITTKSSCLCSCYMSVASPFVPPSSFCQPAASFTYSGRSSCCPRTSFLTHYLIAMHMGGKRPYSCSNIKLLKKSPNIKK